MASICKALNKGKPLLFPLSRYFSNTGSGHYDLIIVGGGIVGLATAREVSLRYPHKRIAVVEKEKEIAKHQSGHNSGVIHTGIYYTPGTMKAKLCVRGADLMYQYCEQNNIPHKRVGKVIVAVNESEIPRLKNLYERGVTNGVKGLRLIGPDQLREIEPYCKGVMAIHSPNTGIVDYGQVAQSYASDVQEKGGHIYTEHEVIDFTEERSNTGSSDDFHVGVHFKNQSSLSANQVITCGGLYSDRLSLLSGCDKEPSIVPFRGEYLVLKKEKSYLVKGNIYPVPNPEFPFLGVHYTPRMDGTIWCGPNAILAFAREGYKLTDFNWKDLRESLQFRGLRKLVKKHLRFGLQEVYRGTVMTAQLKQLQQYIPDITLNDIDRSDNPSGVRAQAMNNKGNLIEDFIFHTTGTAATNNTNNDTNTSSSSSSNSSSKMLHVRNAPSPAATSSLSIAEMIVNKAHNTFDWNNNNN